MTSEEKASAWLLAAILLGESERNSGPLQDTAERERVRAVVIPHLRKRADRIRSSSKARREKEEA